MATAEATAEEDGEEARAVAARVGARAMGSRAALAELWAETGPTMEAAVATEEAALPARRC